MPRYALTIEYDGTAYCGWQAQENGLSVQSAIERALLGLNGEFMLCYGAGRTDAGVHALAQVAHADMLKEWRPQKLCDGLNAWLRDEKITILHAREAETGFHARFSATGRRYLYRILRRRAPPALERNRVWHVKYDLDAGAMHEAAQKLVGHHDFTTFRALHCQAASPVKTLDRLDVMQMGEEIHIHAASRSFLHTQVRSMVGTLKMVGQGKWAVADVAKALAARDRTACGPVAPPEGLYLAGVDYDAK
ncbi:MAG: tRNA pseudouridine(38-40) synthase TruA [Aestuariivirgaceae bacterium]|nr:tRNA pseudouridine(38-40) synthase TruA [Aestuariivirgaceae bacterium]